MIDVTCPGRRIDVGGRQGLRHAGLHGGCQERNVTPHVAQNITRNVSSAIDARTTRHPGYAVSQRFRKRIEEVFGWMKTVGNFRKTRYRGLRSQPLAAYMLGAAYNLLRVTRLMDAPT